MKLLQSIIVAATLSAFTLPTFAMDDDGDPSKTDPFYRAASGKTHMTGSKHADAMQHDGEMKMKMKHSKSGKQYLHPVFSPHHILTPPTDNR